MEVFRFNIRRPWRVFLLSTFIVLVLGTILNDWGKRLETPSAPSAMVSFELAGNEETSQKVRCEWHWKGQTKNAIRSLWLDFFFIPAYVISLLLAGHWASRQLVLREMTGALATLYLARLQPLAGALDIGENIALLLLLGEKAGGSLAFWAALAAALKFLFIGLGLVTILWAGFVRYGLRIQGSER